jgi:hypothetical protein
VNWENHHGGDLGKCRCCLVVGRSCSSCNNYNHMGMGWARVMEEWIKSKMKMVKMK